MDRDETHTLLGLVGVGQEQHQVSLEPLVSPVPVRCSGLGSRVRKRICFHIAGFWMYAAYSLHNTHSYRYSTMCTTSCGVGRL